MELHFIMLVVVYLGLGSVLVFALITRWAALGFVAAFGLFFLAISLDTVIVETYAECQITNSTTFEGGCFKEDRKETFPPAFRFLTALGGAVAIMGTVIALRNE